MSVARKPKSVDEFISGATVAQETSGEDQAVATAVQPVKMRIPHELLEALDEARSARKPKPSRHQFILEALYEKIDRRVKALSHEQ